MLYDYTVKVTHVVDGDTFDADVDLGFKIWVKMRFRLYGLDTPELNSKDEAERGQAGAAMRRLQGLIQGKTLKLHSIKDKQEKYGRYLARIFTEEGNDVAAILISEGLGKLY